MNKFTKRLLALVMGCFMLICVGAQAACKKPDDGIWIDPNRTQLFVGVKENGIGREWIDKMVIEYEKLNPDIQVIVETKNTEFDSDNLKATIKNNRQDVYFISMLDYFGFVDADTGTSDLILDITDVATEKNGQEKSLWEKMDDVEKDYFNVGTTENPKTFAFPYCQSYWGLIYDKDFFAGMGLYNLDEYVGIDTINGNDDDAYGPDGKPDTFDDGLPATWEDFKILLDVMVQKGITPFTWTGQYYTYRTGFLNSVLASYEGENDYELRYSFDGVDSQFGKIDNSNAYKLQEQEGVKAALTVAKHIASNSNYYSGKVTNLSHSHKQAQLEFVKSIKSKHPIGFLMESGWWENEAKNYFNEMESQYGEEYGYGKRNFGWLPFPKFIGTEGIANQTNTQTVLCSGGGDSTTGACVISKNSDQIALAKDFVKFTHSDENLALFTATTGMRRQFEYDLGEYEDELSPYAKEIMMLASDPNVAKVGGKNRNSLRSDNRTYFSDWVLGAKLSLGTVGDPLITFINNSNLSVNDYWNGIKTIYNATTWAEKLGQ